MGYYAASSGNFLPTFRDILSVPSSRVKVLDPCFLIFLPLCEFLLFLVNSLFFVVLDLFSYFFLPYFFIEVFFWV
jgi:hypothetical protein